VKFNKEKLKIWREKEHWKKAFWWAIAIIIALLMIAERVNSRGYTFFFT
jgi:hypothetical protein